MTARTLSHSLENMHGAGEHAWRHHEKLLTLARERLSDGGASAAGALEVLYRLRAYRPNKWIGGPSFEDVNAKFFATMDDEVLSKAEHLTSLHDEDVYRSMSLYLGMVHTSSAHEMLRKIAGLARDNEQTLIVSPGTGIRQTWNSSFHTCRG